MTCWQSVKEKWLSFIYHCIIYSDCSPINHDQICSLTYHLIPITCSQILTPQLLAPPYRSIALTHLVPVILMSKFLPDCSIYPTNSVLVKLATWSLAPFYPHSPWSFDVKHITPRSIPPHYCLIALTHPVSSLLLLSLVLFFQIFLWFLIFLALVNIYLPSTPALFPTTLVFFVKLFPLISICLSTPLSTAPIYH